MSTDDVKNELTELEVPVRSVEKFKNTKFPLIFTITVPKNVSAKELSTKARYIQRTRVYYEPHISKRELIQCKKCQAWGHATANCHLNVVRCVKCAGSHRSYDCDKSKDAAALCCNCSGKHPASSPDCPIYKKAVETKHKRNAQPAPASDRQRYKPAPPPTTNAWTDQR